MLNGFGELTALKRSDKLIWNKQSGELRVVRGEEVLLWGNRRESLRTFKGEAEFHTFVIVLCEMTNLERVFSETTTEVTYELK